MEWGGKGDERGIGIMLPAWAKQGTKRVIWERQIIKYKQHNSQAILASRVNRDNYFTFFYLLAKEWN